MEESKGFYMDFVCKQAFFQATDAEYAANVEYLINEVKSKLDEARLQADSAAKGWFLDKGCELTGFGWK